MPRIWRWCAARSRRIAKRWCACTSRFRSSICSIMGAARIRGRSPRRSRHWRKAESGVLVLLHRPESALELRQRAPCPTRRARDEDGLAQLRHRRADPARPNVGRMRLLARPRKMPSMAGFGLEVTGHLESPRRSALRCARRAHPEVQRAFSMPFRRNHARSQNRPEHPRRAHARGHRRRSLQCRRRRSVACRRVARARRAGVRKTRSRSRPFPAHSRFRSRCSAWRRPAITMRWSRSARSFAARPIISKSSPTNRRPAWPACNSNSARRSAMAF